MFGDIGKMMKLVGEMKRKMPEMQSKLAATEYWAEAGEGLVRAAVNGKFQIMDVKIDPRALAGGAEALGDQLKAAIISAQAKAAEAAQAAMMELTGGMKLPGMDAFP